MNYSADLAMQLAPRTPPRATKKDNVRIEFSVSLNEEHVHMDLVAGQLRLAFGERAHHYSLLVLARLRLEDAGRGLDPSSQGWIETEELARRLGMDIPHLNIHIFRARNQLREAGEQLGLAIDLIERRRCELRFAGHSFRILRGSRLEGSYAVNQRERIV